MKVIVYLTTDLYVIEMCLLMFKVSERRVVKVVQEDKRTVRRKEKENFEVRRDRFETQESDGRKPSLSDRWRGGNSQRWGL